MIHTPRELLVFSGIFYWNLRKTRNLHSYLPFLVLRTLVRFIPVLDLRTNFIIFQEIPNTKAFLMLITNHFQFMEKKKLFANIWHHFLSHWR